MGLYLGIDTSNYTTSAAVYDSRHNKIYMDKRLLTVKNGECGLQQSTAVFQHNAHLPHILDNAVCSLFNNTGSRLKDIEAVGVSARPRDIEGSYMPCFTVGMSGAKIISKTLDVPYHEFSHQAGHIMAALFSCDRLDLINRQFIAFHVSGGTTEALVVSPDEQKIIDCQIVAKSLDLKAGQVIDRMGVMMGLDFPAGAGLDELAQKSDKQFKIKPTLKECDCCMSGIENKCRQFYESGNSKEDTAKYCITYIMETLDGMTAALLNKYGDLPLIFAGGVMSNSMIKQRFTEKYGAYFAQSCYSSDNAAGTAILTYMRDSKEEIKL